MYKKNKIKAIIAFAVALAFILPTSAMFVNDEGTLTVQPEMSILPATQTVEKGNSFTVDVYIDPKDYSITGANVDLLSFDPAIIQAKVVGSPPHASVTFAGFFGGAGVFTMYGTVDNVAGTITGILEATIPYAPTSNAGTWITIDFTAIEYGNSQITMDVVGLGNKTGKPIDPITIFNGEVIVSTGEVYILDISVEGSGTTDPAPGMHSYVSNSVVELTATPDISWSFDRWEGDVADPNSATTTITMDDNKTITAIFKEETSNPPTSAVDPLPLWKNMNTVPFMVTATAFDDTGIINVTLWYRYSKNGTEWTDWTSHGIDEEEPWSWSFTGSDGYYEFYSIAIDEHGNVEDPPDVADASTGIDTVPPFTEINLSGTIGDNGWYVSNVGVTLDATDEGSGVESTWYCHNYGHWKIYFNSFVVSGEGYHTLEYYSFDRAGNKEDIKMAEFKIDTKPPVTTHEFDGVIGEEGWFVGNVTVTLSATDATSGVNCTKYNLNNDAWIIYVEPFIVTENDDHILYYYSVDLAGNTEDTNEVEFKIEHDIVPPVTIHEFDGTMGDNDWFTSDVIVVLSAEDDSAGVDYTMYKLDDDTEWQKYTGILVTEDGNHNITYYSVDRVGNKENYTGPFDFKIDKTTPTIDLDVEGAGSTWLLKANVSDETSGIAKVEFYVNGEFLDDVTSLPYECEYTGARRGDIAQAIAFDKAGNLKISNEKEGQSQDQDMIGWTFLIGMISNVEESENIITAQAIRLRYIEVASTGITVGFVKMKVVEFSSHNLLGRTLRSFGQMSLVFGIFKCGITINDG